MVSKKRRELAKAWLQSRSVEGDIPDEVGDDAAKKLRTVYKATLLEAAGYAGIGLSKNRRELAKAWLRSKGIQGEIPDDVADDAAKKLRTGLFRGLLIVLGLYLMIAYLVYLQSCGRY